MFSNIGFIVIVASVLNPEVRWGLIDRYLVQAEVENIPVLIVINKIDLLKSCQNKVFLEKYQKHVDFYKKVGYEVFEISSLYPHLTKNSFKRFKDKIKNKLIGISGHSGAGKSCLVNLMKPNIVQNVDEDSDIFYKGRHTTTYNSLLYLGIGAWAIDTPGIRAFEIEKYDSILLSYCFREFREFKCKYTGCKHDAEEESDCGIKDALNKGLISQERYRSFLSILKGVSFREGKDQHQDDTQMIADFEAKNPYPFSEE